MNGAFAMNTLYCILLALPTMLAAPLNVYFISDVLRYEIKRKKSAYVLSVLLGGLAGVAFALTGTSEGAGAGIISGVAMLFSSFALLIYLGFNMVEKKWKRFLIVFFSMDILTDLNTMIGGLRTMVFGKYEWSGNVQLMIKETVYSLPAILLDALLIEVVALRIRP